MEALIQPNDSYSIECPECSGDARRSPDGEDYCPHCGYYSQTPPDSYATWEELQAA